MSKSDEQKSRRAAYTAVPNSPDESPSMYGAVWELVNKIWTRVVFSGITMVL